VWRTQIRCTPRRRQGGRCRNCRSDRQPTHYIVPDEACDIGDRRTTPSRARAWRREPRRQDPSAYWSVGPAAHRHNAVGSPLIPGAVAFDSPRRSHTVMAVPGRDPGISPGHLPRGTDAATDGRNKPGHDGEGTSSDERSLVRADGIGLASCQGVPIGWGADRPSGSNCQPQDACDSINTLACQAAPWGGSKIGWLSRSFGEPPDKLSRRLS
jgi:hypothetical protein